MEKFELKDYKVLFTFDDEYIDKIILFKGDDVILELNDFINGEDFDFEMKNLGFSDSEIYLLARIFGYLLLEDVEL